MRAHRAMHENGDVQEREKTAGMSNDEPVVRTDGPLIFHARIGSYAEERLDGLTAAFSSAASRIAEFFGKRLSDLAPINLCFVDVPHSHAEVANESDAVYCLQ